MQLFDYTLATSGLTYAAAKRDDLPIRHVIYDGPWRPKYMPNPTELIIDLVYDYQTRQVLGAQFWSQHDVSQSANTISVMIQNGNTIDDLAFVDMLFQPNFDEPFNYLNLVGQQAVEQERQLGNDQPRITAMGNWQSKK